MPKQCHLLVLPVCLLLVMMLVACNADNVSDETDVSAVVATEAPRQIATVAPTEAPTRVPPTEVVEPTSEPTTRATTEPTIQVAVTEAVAMDSLSEPVAAILNAYRELGNAQSFRATRDVCNEFTNATSSTFEFLQPDLYRYTTTYRDGNTEVQQVAIGDILYLRKDETWEVLPRDAISSSDPEWIMTVGDNDDVEWLMNHVKTFYHNVRMTGQESLDGRTLQVYQFETNDPLHHHTVWIGETDSRFYRTSESWEVVDDDASYTCTVFTTYEYDLPLSIEAPVPN